ncbi:MAG: CBS domain-containing protein [Polyangiaceae bacterium]
MTRFDRPVSSIMTQQVVTCSLSTSLSDTLATLQNTSVNALVVMNRLGLPEGVISMSDLVPHGSVSLDEGWRVRMVLGDGTAASVMTGPVATVSTSASVKQAAEVMLDRNIHQLFVTEGTKLVGTVSPRDLMRAVYAERDRTPVRALMSAPVETVQIGDSIDEAIARLEATNVQALVVVDEDVPVGTFSRLDALYGRALPEMLRSSPVEQMMNQSMLTFEAETPLFRAGGSMAVVDAKRILVVEGKKLLGIITGPDVARWMVR